MVRPGFFLLLLTVSTVSMAGCGSEFTFAPVEGTVTKNGKPLANVEVWFYGDPDAGTLGPLATGRTDKTGHYQLRGALIKDKSSQQEGAVVGKQRVVIFDPSERRAKTPEDKRRVPSIYGLINGTPLRVEVRSEKQVIDLEVK